MELFQGEFLPMKFLQLKGNFSEGTNHRIREKRPHSADPGMAIYSSDQ
jgi:hypothetical protein